MSCMKFLILAPVYLETATESERNDETIMDYLQDGSDFLPTYEFRVESPIRIEKHQSVTRTFRKSKFDLLSSLRSNLDRNYLNFPFITDKKTFMYLSNKDTKVMFIMRGLAGSGKSSIVSVIRSLFSHVVVCSADDFFLTEDGSYKFDEKLLSAAHGNCQQKAKQACVSKVPVVVIDNTNVRKWELKFYADLANISGYVVVLVQPQTPWRWYAKELAARTKHGVSVEVLQRKVLMFDDVIPVYYGWFPNERQSKRLTRLCLVIFLECLSKFPELKRDLLRELKINVEKIDEETAKGILSAYYSCESNKSPLLHCTAKFCARGKAPGARDYHKRPDVQQACGQMVILTVTGLVITNKTLGARVNLGPSASGYFAHPEESEWDSKSPNLSRESVALRTDKVRDTFDKRDRVVISNRKAKKTPLKFKNNKKQKSSPKNKEDNCEVFIREENRRFHIRDRQVSQLKNAAIDGGINEMDSSFLPDIQKTSESFVSLSDMFPALNFSSRSRSAHFTIKTARGVESREVNYDILRACDAEASGVNRKSDFVQVSRGHACYYGGGLCCVYFKKPLCVRTLFSGYY